MSNLSGSFYDAFGDIDDTKSVVSKNGGKSVVDGHRSRLLNKDYTSDECLEILSNLGLGYTADQAAKKATSLTENVKSVELLDPRKMTTGSDRLSDTQIGRNIFEAVRNMISQGNEPLVSVVRTNISLDSYLSDVQARMFELESNISQLESSYTEPVEPKEDRINLRMDVEIERKELQLRQIALKEYEDRTGTVPNEDEGVKRGRKLKAEDTWEGSPEKSMLELKHAEYIKVTTRKYREIRLQMYDDYDEQVAKKASVLKDLKTHRDYMRRQQVIEIFVSELKKQCNLVVQKLKTALMSYPFIREKLAQNVIVNGESIVQPLATDNLSGIYALLHQEYNKITMGAFCDYLMGLMSESSSKEESNRTPQLQLKRMDKHLKTWLDMDLEKFMTPDHLFTICLLKSYHTDTAIRNEGVRHVLEYSRRLESNSLLKLSVGEYANMPLYTELVRWINDVHVKSMQFSNNTSSTTTSVTRNSANTNTSSSSNSSDRRNNNMESAAAVSESTYSSGKRGPVKIPANCTYATGPYEGEVLKNNNLCGKSGFRYQALINKCNPCPHNPKCFMYKCGKCNYYGHKADDCCQAVVRNPVTDDTRHR